jgi:hypothetical protein
MSLRRFRIGAVVVLMLLWLASGPLAMLVGGCASMGSDCEGPCGITAVALHEPDGFFITLPLAPIVSEASDSSRSRVLVVLEPPPKLSPLA